MDAVVLLELLHHAERHGRTVAATILSDEMSRPGIGVQILQHVVPDRRNGRRHRRPLPFDHVDQRFGLQEPVGQHQIRAGHQGRVGLPRLGVEHRHDRQHPVAVDEADRVGRADRHRVQIGRAMAVDDAFGFPVVPLV